MARQLFWRLGAPAFLLILSIAPSVAPAADSEGVLIRCTRPCTAAVAAVRGLGGAVTEQYENIDAVAAKLPRAALPQLTAALGTERIIKDVLVNRPIPRDVTALSDADAPVQSRTLAGAELNKVIAALPNNYIYNNNLTGASAVHAQGNTGQGVIVGVIDTGAANAPVVPAIAGTVIGGQSLVPAAEDPVSSATSRLNDSHGTWVSGMIASHAIFLFSNTSGVVRGLSVYSPESVFTCPNPNFSPCPAGFSWVPVIGTAPEASIYVLKVFPSSGEGAPESRIIAAMDRAITMRRNFNKGKPSQPVSGTGTENDPFVYDSLNLRVVNMSLGGPTFFAGRDLEDQLTEKMLDVGITLVTAAGNDGFPALTVGSPGTGRGSLTTGAANTPVHEGVLRVAQFGPVGTLFRANDHIQTADFSSRGPTADGRADPDITANGYASFAQATCSVDGAIVSQACVAGTGNAPFFFVSGTSLSSPTVAGAAALLRKASTNTTATQVRNALMQSANPNTLGDNSGRNDQGKGFVDIPAAIKLLLSGKASNKLPDTGHHQDDDVSSSVAKNIEEQGYRTINFNNDSFFARVRNLVPGQVKQFFVPSDIFTDQFVVTLSNITPQLPPEEQNQLFGDDVFLEVVDAPTSFGEFRVIEFVNSETPDPTFPVDNPQTGLVRVALQGDWTNAGAISADVTITRARGPFGKDTADGDISQGEVVPVDVNVPAGTKQVVFEVHWKGNWSRYPSNDIDVTLLPPGGGAPNTDGATGNSPERVVIDNPAAGKWRVLIEGFEINTNECDHGDNNHRRGKKGPEDDWTLAVTADGVRLTEAKH